MISSARHNPLAAKSSLLLVSAAIVAALSTTTSKAADINDAVLRQRLQVVGDCLVAGREAIALESMVRTVDGGDYETVYAAFYRELPRCLDKAAIGFRRMWPAAFDSIVSDSLVRHFYRDQDPGSLADVDVVAGGTHGVSGIQTIIGKERASLLRGQLSQLGYSFAITLGECVVRRDSAGVRQLLHSVAGSADEKRKYAALDPAFDGCLPDDIPFRPNIFAARGALAVNYLTLANAQTKARKHA